MSTPYADFLPLAVHNGCALISDASRIPPRWEREQSIGGGGKHTILPILPKTAWNWNNLDAEVKASASLTTPPLRSATAYRRKRKRINHVWMCKWTIYVNFQEWKFLLFWPVHMISLSCCDFFHESAICSASFVSFICWSIYK